MHICAHTHTDTQNSHSCQHEKKFKKTGIDKYWRGCGGKAPLYIEISTATVEDSMEILQKKLRRELPYHPAIPLRGIYLNSTKTLIQKDVCTLRSLQHYLQ